MILVSLWLVSIHSRSELRRLRCSRVLVFLGDAEGLKIGLPHEIRVIRGFSAATRVFSRFFDHAPNRAGMFCVVMPGP